MNGGEGLTASSSLSVKMCLSEIRMGTRSMMMKGKVRAMALMDLTIHSNTIHPIWTRVKRWIFHVGT